MNQPVNHCDPPADDCRRTYKINGQRIRLTMDPQTGVATLDANCRLHQLSDPHFRHGFENELGHEIDFSVVSDGVLRAEHRLQIDFSRPPDQTGTQIKAALDLFAEMLPQVLAVVDV